MRRNKSAVNKKKRINSLESNLKELNQTVRSIKAFKKSKSRNKRSYRLNWLKLRSRYRRH
jgi:hypothetical protein